MTYDRFPGAPAGSWVSEEGWLICGDEAWTEQEWPNRPRTDDPAKYHNRYQTDSDRLEARRRTNREYMRRRRERNEVA